MGESKLRLTGVELYFDDLVPARQFYQDTLGLPVHDEELGHHVQFDGGNAFVCLEKRGVESYPSADKAVVFFETSDLEAAVKRIGPDRFVESGRDAVGQLAWAVLHDPEGHNVLLLRKTR
jgi:catechol 2,3-dioxygenase-like lactoylglutathione lyase family enzyme